MSAPWLDVLDDTIRSCAAHNRPDLAARLRETRSRQLDPKLRVLVLGEPKQGKSQLVNAMVNAPVCAVGDDVTTTVPTFVQHAETPNATLVRTIANTPTERIPVPIDQLADQVSAGHTGELLRAEVGIPRALLTSGLVLIDTPGVGDLRPAHTASTFAALLQADAVLMVSDATAELTASEIELLKQVMTSCPNVTVVLTKIDIAAQWRRVVERNRAHLARAGVAAKLIPVSAALRLRAAKTGDTALNAESGFPELLACVQQDIVAAADVLARRTVAVTAASAIKQLVAPVREELTDQGPQTTIAKLTEAQRRIDELRRRSARWQTVLSDEMADLVSDLEYDLRDRTRRILREVDKTFETADPARGWQAFEDWLEDNLTEAAATNFTWLLDRSEWVAEKVARSFPVHREDLMPESVFPADVLDRVSKMDKPVIERFTVSQKLFTGLRGSYGGVLMFGLVTSLAGMPLINVISLGAGALFGGKSILDESDQRLKRRQAAAKVAAQRHVDDFFIKFSKDFRDAARTIQRSLRGHFSTLADDLQETLLESARSARRAVQADAAERERRAREAKRELDRLVQLYQRVQAVAGSAPPLGISA
ncbi:dynamin family protein [Actinosynnema sp. NPDC047251]|uniref:GTP-binding protein n=1 Tax=Saccharothrix espanaensis (strain ATCC 51144 / DSM 44229 / JCM 9112 / NBRC 15066 / NRRL 15764) TaxID=1179773 RepID=K0JUM3_SACES|nr:dynamin family protein [Saccharothrix espanaensis]CCH27933.1 GTP-binding protein [Saccharothrix espanaensis DSM 44229]